MSHYPAVLWICKIGLEPLDIKIDDGEADRGAHRTFPSAIALASRLKEFDAALLDMVG